MPPPTPSPSPSPYLEIKLWTDRFCHLSPSSNVRYNLVVFITLRCGSSGSGRGQKAVTIVREIDDDDDDDEDEEDDEEGGVGLVNLLISRGGMECLDMELGEGGGGKILGVLERARATTTRTMMGKKKKKKKKRISLMTLVEDRADYITFTTASDPRDYEFGFTTRDLRPDREYTLRCNLSLSLPCWSYDSKEAVLDYLASHEELPPLTKTQQPLRCEPINTVSFHTRQEVPRPPKVDVSLTAQSTSFSHSGKPPFEFSISFTSHAPHPITVLAERHRAISLDSDIEILVDETVGLGHRRRVAPDLIDENIDGPWQPEDFLQLLPEMPYRERRVLDPTAQAHCSLADLAVGTSYVLRVPDGRWGWWSRDPVEKVMQYARERGSGSLGYTSAIKLRCADEVRFCVVE